MSNNLELMKAACEAAANGDSFDPRAMKAAAVTIGLMAECPDAVRAVVLAARKYPALLDGAFIDEISQHAQFFIEIADARNVICEIQNAFPGATVATIENRMTRVLRQYAEGLQDSGMLAARAIGIGHPTLLRQFEDTMDESGEPIEGLEAAE